MKELIIVIIVLFFLAIFLPPLITFVISKVVRFFKELVDKIIKIFNENGFKNGKIKEIICTLPYDEKKPWRVYASVKTGTWPFNDKEEDIEIYSIMDNELSNLIET